MREQSLDEFESIFEQASIPVLEIEPVTLARVAVVLKNDALDASVCRLAAHLKTRFGSEVQVHYPDTLSKDSVAATTTVTDFAAAPAAFRSTAELVGQVSIGRSQLVLMPEPEDEAGRVVSVDALVEGTSPPILLVRSEIDEPASVFSRVLHSLTGSFQQTQNFSHSFTLVEDAGQVLLLHVVSEAEVADVRDAMRVSPEVDTEEGEKLVEKLSHHGERFLKGVVAAAREAPYDASYRLAVGDIVETVRTELEAGGYSVLVVGHHVEGHSHISADDYQLMHTVRDIPVLAL